MLQVDVASKRNIRETSCYGAGATTSGNTGEKR